MHSKTQVSIYWFSVFLFFMYAQLIFSWHLSLSLSLYFISPFLSIYLLLVSLSNCPSFSNLPLCLSVSLSYSLSLCVFFIYLSLSFVHCLYLSLSYTVCISLSPPLSFCHTLSLFHLFVYLLYLSLYMNLHLSLSTDLC